MKRPILTAGLVASMAMLAGCYYPAPGPYYGDPGPGAYYAPPPAYYAAPPVYVGGFYYGHGGWNRHCWRC